MEMFLSARNLITVPPLSLSPALHPQGLCWFLSSLKPTPISLFEWFHSLAGPDASLLLPRGCCILKFLLMTEEPWRCRGFCSAKSSSRWIPVLPVPASLVFQRANTVGKHKVTSRGVSLPFLGICSHPCQEWQH